MENLNDVEFGSEKSTEEAPILVAQRYLNIYRQVHIFNKAKRDQFDDELLALPPTITDFFKRMPGGRLLVEHIEEVKTERGISFVKSSKEDFAEGSGTLSTPAPQTNAVVPAGVGGSVTVDASFAEALAKSMATAFNQNPIQTTVSGNFTPSGTIDFGNAFDVIAEEIKTSRACVLDILKETKSMTDTVIASQVSISRILEGILSSKTKGDIGAADLNNRIIASQTSITKLLEGLYNTSNVSKGDISTYLNIDKKLQEFKSEIKKEVEDTIFNALKNFDATKLVSSRTYETLDEATNTEDVNDYDSLETTNFNNIENTQKKKKKKKKKNKEFQPEDANNNSMLASVSAPIVGGVIHNKLFKHEDNFKNINLDEPPLELDDDVSLDIDVTSEPEISSLASLDNSFTIKDIEDETSQDIDDGLAFELPEQSLITENTDNNDELYDESSLSDELDDGLSYELPEQGSAIKTGIDNEESTHTASSDYDEFDLVKEFPEDDGLSLELPEKDMEFDDIDIDDTDLDDNFSKNYEANPTTNASSSPSTNNIDLDRILSSNDEITFEENPYETIEDNNKSDEDFTSVDFDNINTIEDVSLDDFAQSSSFEESVIEANSENNFDYLNNEELNINDNSFEQFNEDTDFSNEIITDENRNFELDNIFSENASIDSTSDIKEEIDVSNTNILEEGNETQETPIPTDIESFLGFSTNTEDEQTEEDEAFPEANPQEEIIESIQQPQSRYSAELDKIRAALTSDNVDLSSIDEPIALDDYSDDENVHDEDYSIAPANTTDDDWEYEYVEEDTAQSQATEFTTNEEQPNKTTNDPEDWEWEYVDENGNPIEGDENSEDWEWEYVEEEENNTDNNQ